MLTFSAIPSLVPEEEWWWFVEASNIREWFLRLFINGTYPVFPWLAFFTIGGWLEHTQLATIEKKQVLARSGLLAFATLVLTGTLSFITGRSWALTIGNGTLTFFPANPYFVLAVSYTHLTLPTTPYV